MEAASARNDGGGGPLAAHLRWGLFLGRDGGLEPGGSLVKAQHMHRWTASCDAKLGVDSDKQMLCDFPNRSTR